MENKKIHNHPQMEKDLNVPEDHCIIDKDIFFSILEKENDKIQFIIDLLELKNISLRNQSLTIQEGIIANNNTFYAVLDSLISMFIDKYKLDYNKIRDKYYEKRFNKQ